MQSVVRADLTKLELTGVISCMCIPLAWYEVTLHTLECPHRPTVGGHKTDIHSEKKIW